MRAPALLAIALLSFGPAQALEWPELPAPAQAKLGWVMPDGFVNGFAGRIAQARWNGSMDEAVAHYRERWGQRMVQNRIKTATVLATRQGEVFVTVQLRELPGAQVQATILQTAMGDTPQRSPALVNTQGWLPESSKVLQTLESKDGADRALTLVAVNEQSIDTNAAQIERMARMGGMKAVPDDKAAQDALHRVLRLQGRDEEAVVVLSRDPRHTTVIVNRTRKGAS